MILWHDHYGQLAYNGEQWTQDRSRDNIVYALDVRFGAFMTTGDYRFQVNLPLQEVRVYSYSPDDVVEY